MAEQNGHPMIEAQGLSKFYGNFAAASDVTFSVPQGQVCAFLCRKINHHENAHRVSCPQ